MLLMNNIPLPPLAAADDQKHAPGLVWALHSRSGEAPAPLRAVDIPSALDSNDGWVWLHIDLVDQRALAWTSRVCGLPQAARAVFEGHDVSLALAHEAGVVHGIMVDLDQDMSRKSTSVGRLHFAVKQHVLVTGRRHSLEAVEQVRTAALGGGLRPDSAFALFEAIVAAFCRNTTKRLADATVKLDQVEDNLVTERIDDERFQLKDVRRLAVSLHRPIASLVALFEDEDRNDWQLSDGAHAVMHRLAARLRRLDREVVTVNDRARLLQEEVAAEMADESNRSLRALALMSALLLPGTLIVGVFGMNVAGLPFTESSAGFIVTLILAAGATGLFYWLLLRAGANFRG